MEDRSRPSSPWIAAAGSCRAHGIDLGSKKTSPRHSAARSGRRRTGPCTWKMGGMCSSTSPLKMPVLVRGLGVVREVAMGRHGALGAPGECPRCEGCGEVVGATRHRVETVRMRGRRVDERAVPGVVEFRRVRHAGQRAAGSSVASARDCGRQTDGPGFTSSEKSVRLVALVGRFSSRNTGCVQRARQRGRAPAPPASTTCAATRSPGCRPSATIRSAMRALERARTSPSGPRPAVGQDHAGGGLVFRKVRGEQAIEVPVH